MIHFDINKLLKKIIRVLTLISEIQAVVMCSTPATTAAVTLVSSKMIQAVVPAQLQ
jgi:hypothetical protein